jgi:glycine cleavage system H protein
MNQTEYKYTQHHIWVCHESENIGRIGITDYAQSQLGEIVFLDLPVIGAILEQNQKMGEIEAQKTVSDLFAPVSGKVIGINTMAYDNPKLVNEAPYGDGWLVKLELFRLEELDSLICNDEYNEIITRS